MSSSADWMQPRKEFEDTSVETSQTEKQRDFFKLKKKEQNTPKLQDKYKGITYT